MKTITPEQLLAETQALRELWQTFFNSPPVDSHFALWLAEHPLERMVYAVTRTGVRYRMRTLTCYDLWYRIKLTTKFADEQQAEDWKEERERKGLPLLASSASTEVMPWYAYDSNLQWRLAMSKAEEERKERQPENS